MDALFQDNPALMNVWLHVFLFHRKPEEFWSKALQDPTLVSFVPCYLYDTSKQAICDRSIGEILERVGFVMESFPTFLLEGPNYKRKGISVPHADLSAKGWYVVTRSLGTRKVYFEEDKMQVLFKALYDNKIELNRAR